MPVKLEVAKKVIGNDGATVLLDLADSFGKAIESGDRNQILRAISRMEHDRGYNPVWNACGAALHAQYGMAMAECFVNKNLAVDEVMVDRLARTMAYAIGGPLMLEKLDAMSV